jgi:pyruvate,water dikinase
VYRERARLKQALLYSRCRRVAIAIGAKFAAAGQLGAANDIFFLTYQEIDALGSGAAMFAHGLRSTIELRRTQHVELSAMHPPDSFVLPEGGYLPLYSEDKAEALAEVGRATLLGTGACGGKVTGCAAVLSNAEEAYLIGKGDVLVTKQTDPGWAPVFYLIRGLVIERGGMLSHGAIVAREFGLPCVVGATGATRIIAHGQSITIDGDKGEVGLS